MPDCECIRKLILENCRMPFDQEVKIITTYRSPSITVIVLPKACSLKSIAQCNTDKILLEYGCFTLEGAMNGLLQETQSKLAQAFIPPISPSGSTQNSQINKAAIHSICNIVALDSTKAEQTKFSVVTSCTQTSAEEDKAESDKTVEETVLGASSKRLEGVTALKEKIWRVVGYTSSSELCIEEHQSEAPNTGNSFISPTPNHTFADAVENRSRKHPLVDTRTDFTPGTSVMSDSGTTTPSSNDQRSPACCAERLDIANMQVAHLRKNLEEANWEIGTLEGDLGAIKKNTEELEQRLLGAENRCKDQEEQIEAYKVGKRLLETTMVSMSNEIISLKETIRSIEATAEKRWRERVEQVIESLK